MNNKINKKIKQVEKIISEEITRQDIIDKNRFFKYILKNQSSILSILALIALTAPLLLRYLQNRDIIGGPETYYLLTSSPYNFLQYTPNYILNFLPLVLGLSTVFLFIRIAKIKDLPARLTFFIALFTILSPAFIYTFSTLGTYSFGFPLLLLGIILLNSKKTKLLAWIPLFLLPLIDLLTTSIALIYLIFFVLKSSKKQKKVFLVTAIGLALVTLMLAATIHNIDIKLAAGPFFLESMLSGLLSDFGGNIGIGSFVFVLAIIGLLFSWKKKNYLHLYVLAAISVAAFVYNSHSIFYLSLTATVFSTIAFITLFQRKWVLDNLKALAFYLLLLGVLFSAISYVDRVAPFSPTLDEIEILQWMDLNIPKDAKIASFTSNSYRISFFAKREPISFHHSSLKDINLTNQIFEATYVQDLFPILEQNEIFYFYINKKMKQKLLKDQGFLFLLQNERFKFMHSHGEHEVWMFNKGD